MIDLTPILQALVGLIGTVITAMLVPFIKSKTSVQQLERMQSWARIGVKAAEQLYSDSGQGKRKKQYVMDFLIEHGFTVDFTELEALIESAVNDIKSEQSFIIEQEAEING